MYARAKVARKHYGVTDKTLRIWSDAGKIKSIRTKGNQRRYFVPMSELESQKLPERRKIIYARVSSSKQKSDLQNQIKFLQQRYPSHELITDIGSVINFKRKGFKTILELLFKRNIKEVVVATYDRFSRFGIDLFKDMFKQFNSKLISVNAKEFKSPEQELAEDLLSIITVFSARYHGRRKYHVNKKD